jgi:hypothetical protein
MRGAKVLLKGGFITEFKFHYLPWVEDEEECNAKDFRR